MKRFWKHVDKSGDCWEWTACKSRGYGKFGLDGKTLRAHRVSYALEIGPIPDGMVICHKCDNPGCVNPAHLFAETQKHNLSDMRSKGRAAHLKFLTRFEVAMTRLLFMSGMKQAAIGREFDVTRSRIHQIVRG